MMIAEVSKRFGLSPDTLRYYERVGLIPPVNRTASGIRDYTEEDCRWIEFIKCMRGAGLSIEVLIKYVSLFQQGDATIDQRKELCGNSGPITGRSWKRCRRHWSGSATRVKAMRGKSFREKTD